MSPTRLTNHRRILELQGFQAFDEQAKVQVATEIATMARRHLKPRLIFGRCIDFLIEKLQDISEFFPPKIRSKLSPKIGSYQIDDTDAVSTA